MRVEIPGKITYLEKRQEQTNEKKFWAVGFRPAPGGLVSLVIWWGRIGTKGQTQMSRKPGPDNLVLREARERLEAKLREGYKQTTTTDWTPPFVAQTGREPAVFGNDGWPMLNGREVRPDEFKKRQQRDADLKALREWEGQPTSPATTPPRRVVRAEKVEITTARVIDFEE